MSQPAPAAQPGEISATTAGPTAARTGRLNRIIANLCPVVLPMGTYYLLTALGHSGFIALLCATVVSALWVLVPAVVHRRFDGLAGFVLAINGLGLLLALVSGSERMILAKDPITDAVVGVLLFGSCVIGRPAMFGIVQRLRASGADQARAWNALWDTDAEVRQIFLRSTLVWGGAFAAVALLRFGMIATLPVSTVVGLGNPVEWVILGLAFAYSMHVRKRMNINARIAAE
ncbi:VC0807 family protein [Nocardia miyunensis]|uniref:VC0807 family protein n=1 Tax=Nocardia miyunensis TaxID=282684 RepID=UPI000831A793|nr:VC0807 family protein [Nocardia miyunensis]